MSAKSGKILGILGLALTGFVTFISGGAAWAIMPFAMQALLGTSLALLAGSKASKSLDATGALQRSTPSADPNALGCYVFGTTLVPMNLVYEEITGSSPDRVLHDVFAHCWHRIQSFQSLTVATETGPETVSFSGNAATGSYANLLWWFRATGTQVAALSGTPFDSNSWPSTAVFAGVTHSGFVWNIDDDNFKAKFSSVPTKLEVVVQGAWLYDPRLDPTYGSGSQDFDTPSSWSFNDGNAALVLLRALIGEYASGQLVWGRGAAESEIVMSSFITAANIADESIDGDIRYRLAGMHQLTGSFEEFVQQWESETGGKLSKSGGRYTVWLPNDDLTPITTITEDDIIQTDSGPAVDHAIAGGLEALYNTARGRYVDATNGYTGRPYPEVSESSAVTEDGGKRVLTQDFSWIQSEAIAQRVARYRVRRSRYQRVWTVALGWKGQSPNYAVFSVHTLNCLETNYQDQTVRVIERRMSYSGLTVLTLQEEASAIYNDTDTLGSSIPINTTASKSSVFGTFGTPPSRYEERVTDPYFDESFGVAWDDDGNGGVSISVGGGEGGGNALILTDASVGTPRLAINQTRFVVGEGEKITGYARMKRTANISLLQLGAQFYRSDTGAYISGGGDAIPLNSKMPLIGTYYTVPFEITAPTPGLASGVSVLAEIIVDMTPTGGGTATVTVSQIHARRSSVSSDLGVPSSITVHPSDTFSGTKVLKATGAWEEPHPITTAEIAAGVTPTNYEYETGDLRRYGAQHNVDSTAAVQAAVDTGHKLFISDNFMPLIGQITIPPTGVTIIGSGYSSGFKLIDSTDAIVFASEDESNPVVNVLMENFRVDGNVANQNQALFNRHIIGIRNLRNSTLRKLWLENANGDAISITEDDSAGVPTNVVVDTVWCTGYIRNGISVTSGKNIKIVNPVCYSPHASADPGDGIDIEINTPLAIEGVTIINPTCYSNTGAGGRGIAVIGSGTDVDNVKVVGGEVYDNTIGLYTYYTRWTKFIGVSSYSNDEDGIKIEGAAVGTQIIGCTSEGNTGYGIREVTATGTPSYSRVIGCESQGNGTDAVTLLASTSERLANRDGGSGNYLASPTTIDADLQVGSSTPVVIDTDGFVELVENGDPSAPASNKVRFYARDNGSGKTQVMAIFSTGAAQIIATQP